MRDINCDIRCESNVEYRHGNAIPPSKHSFILIYWQKRLCLWATEWLNIIHVTQKIGLRYSSILRYFAWNSARKSVKSLYSIKSAYKKVFLSLNNPSRNNIVMTSPFPNKLSKDLFVVHRHLWSIHFNRAATHAWTNLNTWYFSW